MYYVYRVARVQSQYAENEPYVYLVMKNQILQSL